MKRNSNNDKKSSNVAKLSGRNNTKRRNSNNKHYPKVANEEKGYDNKSKDDVNDSSFYYTDDTLKNQLTNYTMTGFLGLPTRLGQYRSDASSSATVTELYASFPSMMRIGISPALETSELINALGLDSSTSGIAKVGLKNYYLLSANNAKTTQYQPNDVLMLIISLGQIASIVGHIKRLFGCMFKYNLRNRDLPNELVTGMFIDYDDFKANLANYRIRFNTILNMLNRLPIPGNVAYIAKWGSMYSNLYVDEYNNDLAQWYFMIPHTTWKFNEEKSETGSGFDTVNIGAITTMSSLLTTLEDMINAVTLSATFNYIFADILRVAEKSNFPLLKFDMLLEGYDAPVLFSEEFNLWIDNCDITGFPKATPVTDGATPNNDVYNNVANGSITYNPYFGIKNDDMNCFLNFKEGNPDVEKKIAATRLKHARHWKYNANNEQGIECGDMYASFIDILYGNPTVGTREWTHGFMTQNGYETNDISPSLLLSVITLSQFNYAPKVLLHNAGDTDKANSVIQGAVDFYTTVDPKVLREMWDAEWLGLLEMR